MADDKEKKSLDEILADLNNILSRMPSLAESIKTPEIKPIDFSAIAEKNLSPVEDAKVEPDRETQPSKDREEDIEIAEESETIELAVSKSSDDNSPVKDREEVKVLENTNDFGVPDIDFLLNMANESSQESNGLYKTETEDKKPQNGGEMEGKKDESQNQSINNEDNEQKENEAHSSLEDELNKLSIEADALGENFDSVKEGPKPGSDINAEQKHDNVEPEIKLNEDLANTNPGEDIEKSFVDIQEETIKLESSQMALEPAIEDNLEERKSENEIKIEDASLNVDSAINDKGSLDIQEETIKLDGFNEVFAPDVENKQEADKGLSEAQRKEDSINLNTIETISEGLSSQNKDESASVVENKTEIDKLDLNIELKEQSVSEENLESELEKFTIEREKSPLENSDNDSSRDEKTLIFEPDSNSDDAKSAEEKTVVFSPSQDSLNPEENQDFTSIEPPSRVPEERIKNVGFISTDRNLLNHALKVMDEICLASESKPMFVKRAFVLDYTEEMNANFINQKASESACVAVAAVGEFPHEKIYELETVFSSGGKIFVSFTPADFSKSKVIDFVMDLIVK